MYLSSDAGGIRTRNHKGLSFVAVPVRVPRQTQVVRVGLEPTNTEVRAPPTKGWSQSLYQLAHRTMLPSSSPRNRTLSNSFEDCRANPSHSQAILFQCPCQESNLIFDLRRVACVSTTLHRHIHSGAGGIRTHKHLFLRQAAQPLAYHTI